MKHIHRNAVLFVLLVVGAVMLSACSSAGTSELAEPTVRPVQSQPSPTPAGKLYADAEGGFSYSLPKGWELREVPGLKYKVAIGPVAEEFTPNINVVDEAFGGSLDDYVALNLKTVGRVLSDLVVVDQLEATTDSGERLIKVMIEDTQNGQRLYQAFYFYTAGDRKIVVTYSRLADGDDQYDDEVDQCMLTFRLGD